MSVIAIQGPRIYQCSLCLPPTTGVLWLYTPHRGPTCEIHGAVLHYEFAQKIFFWDTSDVYDEVSTQQPFGNLSPTGVLPA